MTINTSFISTAQRSPLQAFIRDIRYFSMLRAIRRQRTVAIDSALKLTTNRHVTFSSLGFDQSFLENEAADLMEPFFYGGEAPAPEALAARWAKHFHIGNQAERDLAQRVLPMMNDFVYLLEDSVEQHYV